MANSVLSRYALCVGSVLLFAGCGSLQPPVGPRSDTASTASPAAARGIKALYSFQGFSDGEEPHSNLVVPARVAPYPEIVGTTEYGGGSYQQGTVFGLTRNKNGSWTEKLVYAMPGGANGRPDGIAIPGRLDGSTPVFVTSFGFSSGLGAVTLLRPNPSGNWTLMSQYDFGGMPDGAGPIGPVVADQSGDLYGTTYRGGTQNQGAVYRLKRNGSRYTESVLYSFQGGTDGAEPAAGLTIDSQNNLYGTTQYGGGSFQNGTVFELMPSGSGFTERVLYRFGGQPDGSQAYAGVCRDASGTLYGTTALGGTTNNGTVFKLTPVLGNYIESVLWSFGAQRDGTNPEGGVLVGTNGVVYSTTLNGGRAGTNGAGTIFTLTPSSSGRSYVEKLYNFTGLNGAGPAAGPATDAKGNLYVPTLGGGAHLFGTVSEAPIRAAALACH
jgi:uncharacterized repeat protein (TIGR03803 family)